jgi:HEAT repeat protein
MRTFFVVVLFSIGSGFGQTSLPKKSSATVTSSNVTGPTLDRARSIIDESLKDKNPDTRKHAVQALSLVGAREPYLSQLEVMLDDKDIEVQVAAITSLVDLRNEHTVVALQKALDSDVPEVSFAAAKALCTLNDPAGREALISVLNGETKTSSGFITKQKREALRMLHTPKTMFLFAMRQGVSLAPVPGLGAGVSSVQGILSDPSVSGRAATALMLSSDQSPEVLQALQDALADPDWSVRAGAVHSIALRNDPALMASLAPLLEDKKEAVRVRAAAGYLRLAGVRSTTSKPSRNLKPKQSSPAPPSATSKK